MDRKGQALVEFILVLPVILIILLAIFNVSYIYLEKYNLEKHMETITELYKSGDTKTLKAYAAKEEITVTMNKKGRLSELLVSKNLLISAPGLNKVLGKNYTIETSQVVFEEDNNE